MSEASDELLIKKRSPKMESPSSYYAVCVEKTMAICIQGEDKDQLDLDPGMLLEIKDRSDRYSTVIIHDFYRKNLAFENNMYLVKTNALQQIPAALWDYIAAVSDPLDRVAIARNKQYINYVLDIGLSTLVLVDGRYFQTSPQRSYQDYKRYNVDYECIVRYIGKVDELSPGSLFGLELLSTERGISPQAPEIYHFASKYVSGCDPNHVFLLPINFIRRPSSKTLKKQFKLSSTAPSVISNIICGFKETFKPSQRLSLSSGNKYYTNETSESDSSPPKDQKSSKRPLTPDLVENNNNGRMNSGNKLPSSISSPNLVKNDSGYIESPRTEEQLINFSEDYSKVVERREKEMEERRSSQSRSSLSNGGEARTPKAKKKTLQFPGAPNREIKPAMILSLADRDLVVIDKHDIKEAVNNESQVIIVDPPSINSTGGGVQEEHTDLVDILGSNWPQDAGPAGALLNNEKKSSSTTSSNSTNNGWRTIERNKSANIASHLSNSKPRFESNGYENNKTLPKKKQNGAYENLDQDTSSVASDPISDCIVPSPLIDIPGSKLGLGSLVEVDIGDDKLLHGVIRWIGQKTNQEGIKMNGHNDLIIGVELDEPFTERRLKVNLNDGVYNGQRCFRCPDRRALFVSQKRCKPDRRFPDDNHHEYKGSSGSVRSTTPSEGRAFGAECPIIEGSVAPLKFVKLEDLDAHCGKFKGIQGHHNSCYLDATLFSMFTFTSVFDSLIFRPRDKDDCEQYEEVQRVLREEIVNPLRKKLFVRADRVMKLRQLLDKLSSVKGLVSEEKDPEEFLNSLVAQILRAEPFLKLSSGLDTFCYQLFVEKDERMTFPTVQQLFEQSFLDSDIKLKEVPSCLIIQMPRFGKNYKMYPRILPSQVLDVTDIIEDSPRQCTICGKLAEFECKECFGVCNAGSGLESTAFCKTCLTTVHSHHKRVNHKAKALSIPNDFKIMADYNQVPRLFMELFAVICIETSHYVSFVKCGSGLDSPWVFFDSMADRKGERDGYNIPEMVSVPDLPIWLSEDGSRQLHEANINDKHLPEFARRLYCDAYLMLYQSTEMMMYK